MFENKDNTNKANLRRIEYLSLYLPYVSKRIVIMDLTAYQAELERGLKSYQAARSKASVAIALDGLAMIKKRVVTDGNKPEGGSYEDYSDNALPAWYFQGKSRAEQLAGGAKTYKNSGNSPPFNKLLKQKLKEGAQSFRGIGWSYKEWRDANNLQTDHKDFSFTGKMWKNTRVIIKSITTKGAVVTIAPTDPDSIQKLEWVEERDGKVLDFSKSEIDKLGQLFKGQVLKFYPR